MDTRIRQIVLDFEAAVLRAVANGGKRSYVERARDKACEKLRAMKAGADAVLLEAIFSAAIEIETKSKMAMEIAA